MFAIKKGKFEKGRTVRSIRQEDQELEDAFLQVTRAANGELSDDDLLGYGTTAAETAPRPQQQSRGTSGRYSKAPAAPSNEKVRRNKKIMIISLSVVAAMLVLCIGIGVCYYFVSTADNGLIMDNIYAAGVNLGGLTPEQAKEVLRDTVAETYYSQPITVMLPDATLELMPEDTAVSLDTDLLAEAAYNYGRDGSRSERMAAMAAASLTSYTIDLTPYLTLNTTYIENAIAQLYEENCTSLTQTTIQAEGNRPAGTIPEGADVYDEDADYTTEVYQTLTITMGTRERTFDTAALMDQVLIAYHEADFEPISVEYTIIEPEDLDLDALIAEYCTAPVDAVVDESDYSVEQETWGYGFDQETARELLSNAKYGEEVVLNLSYIKPELVKAELDALLFRDVLAEADTPYSYNPPRVNNLVLACKAVNGTIVKPGETFSFNDALGQRTEEKGYQAAGAYVNGETVDQIGGGICQVASTIYYCSLYSDLEIVERAEHMYAASYVPLGMDATINWGTLDYKFRNNTNYPILIEAEASDGYVRVKLIGTDEKDYYVKMDYKVTKQIDWKTVTKEMSPDNKDGYTDGEVIQTAYTGYVVDTYKYKYNKDTDELISSAYEDHSEYSSRDKIICKIIWPTEAPPTTAPEVTDPAEAAEPVSNNG